eukprot:jgi/Chlat1/2565/Chrsp175S02400
MYTPSTKQQPCHLQPPNPTHKLLAEETIRRHFPHAGLDAKMLRAVAIVESGAHVLAHRRESNGEASVGLMQTLVSTASWLARDMGYRAFGIPKEQDLYDPYVSMYYGAAFLLWLSTYNGSKRSQEFIVRGYNGGPGGVQLSQTARYWNKYLSVYRTLT